MIIDFIVLYSTVRTLTKPLDAYQQNVPIVIIVPINPTEIARSNLQQHVIAIQLCAMQRKN